MRTNLTIRELAASFVIAKREAQAAQAETAQANGELAAALEKELVRVRQLSEKFGSGPTTELKPFASHSKDAP